jgi:hypothetical protein
MPAIRSILSTEQSAMLFSNEQMIRTILSPKVEDSWSDNGRDDELQALVTKRRAVREARKILGLK